MKTLENPEISAQEYNVIQPGRVPMVTGRPANLPDFDNPPVVEVLVSAQFDRLSSMQTAHFGLYWTEIHERYPKTEEHGELPPQIEVLT